MHAPRIILTLLTLTTHAHARDDGGVMPRPGAAPTQAHTHPVPHPSTQPHRTA